MTSSCVEEQALHRAALEYARTRFQTLEVRARVDLAREVSGLLVERDPTTDREFFQRDELDPALDLARLTLLHAGEKDIWSGPDDRRPSATEALLEQVRRVVREAQRLFADVDASKTLGAALRAFNEVVGLVGTCSRLAGEPECTRDGDCPEHGRDRPGQCVPEEATGSRLPAPGQSGEET